MRLSGGASCSCGYQVRPSRQRKVGVQLYREPQTDVDCIFLYTDDLSFRRLLEGEMLQEINLAERSPIYHLNSS
jgi:hypothetical protein